MPLMVPFIQLPFFIGAYWVFDIDGLIVGSETQRGCGAFLRVADSRFLTVITGLHIGAAATTVIDFDFAFGLVGDNINGGGGLVHSFHTLHALMVNGNVNGSDAIVDKTRLCAGRDGSHEDYKKE